MAAFFETRLEFLKGVGTAKAALLAKYLDLHTFGDLIQFFPFRYEDRTKIYQIRELNPQLPYIQVQGTIRSMATVGAGEKKRLVIQLTDGTGTIELIWFRGINWVSKKLNPAGTYLVHGKPSVFGTQLSLTHPEFELADPQKSPKLYLQPVYNSSDALKSKFLDSKGIGQLQYNLLQLAFNHLQENLPQAIIEQFKLMPRALAFRNIHFPSNQITLKQASNRLKFEELFYIQLRLIKLKLARLDKLRGQIFSDTTLLNNFYHNHIPFTLTNAQKRVIKEAFTDLKSGKQMNRLLQGDVGSGKTMVAFICMLIVVSSRGQAAIMAPTEILANQHYIGLKDFTEALGLKMAILTGSSKTKARREIHEKLLSGDLQILVGTHALLEDVVQFKNLGLAIIDEQHRFGVAQRAKLWKKNEKFIPHVLVMTATPIPRTLAMTLYGDLEVSVIDELPSGRKPIKTVHRYEANRLRVFGFMREQIKLGRQIYIVYPLIEESEKMDFNNLMEGYDSISRAFPEYPLSIVHGKMKPADKDFEMQRFVKGETKIMVATTVIEVGVNVPNASVMIIENAERFGLAQLHQLRGRVGRGAEQSYCILITNYKISKESKERIQTMVRTNNGFEIADTDLKLRGPGDMMGTQQSGVLDLMIADLVTDGKILEAARDSAKSIIENDPELENRENQVIKQHIASLKKNTINWSRVS